MKFGKSEILTLLVLVGVIVVIAVFAYLRSAQNSELNSPANQALGDGEFGPTFTDLEGNPFSLEQYSGIVRVVNSWASWCPFCVQELPDFASLAGEFSSDEVVVIAINRKETNVQAKNFLQSINSPAGIIYVQDPTDIFYKSIGGFSMPETVFYDQAGNISTHKRGFMNLAEMRTLTHKALSATNEN